MPPFQTGINLFEKVTCPQKRYRLRNISLNKHGYAISSGYSFTEPRIDYFK